MNAVVMMKPKVKNPKPKGAKFESEYYRRKLEIEADLRENPDDARYKFIAPMKTISKIWKNYEKLTFNGVLENFARCITCKELLQYSPKKGTGSLLRHRCFGKGRSKKAKVPSLKMPQEQSIQHELLTAETEQETQAQLPEHFNPAQLPEHFNPEQFFPEIHILQQPLQEPLLFDKENQPIVKQEFKIYEEYDESYTQTHVDDVGPDPLPVITQADSDRQLFSLLCEIDKYNYLYIFERCKACNVNARQLKYLEREHLRELVPKVNLGVQAEFEYLFKEWKVKNGYLISSDPFLTTTNLTTPANGRSSNNTPTQTRVPDVASQHASQPADDYEVPMTYNDEEESHASFSLSESQASINGNDADPKSDNRYLLTQIIPTVLKKCQQKYKANRGLLSEAERRKLSAAIVHYFLSRDIHLTSSTIDNLAEQISTHFPTESKRTWYYRHNRKGQGRLYTKLYNSQRSKEKSKSRKKEISKPSSSHSFPVPDDEDASMDEEPNEEMDQIQKWLKSNKCEDIDEVISMWRTSLNYRQRQLRNIQKSQDGFTEMINNWPAYTWPSGHYLLNIDFNHLYPNSEAALHERWPIYMSKISNLFEAELKDNVNVELFTQFKLAADELNTDSKEAVLLQLLHAITKPSRCFNTPEGTRRYTIAESQSSVMKLITSVCDLDSVAEPHPCIYLVGDSILSVERCVVAFRDIQYELSLADALCACFQFYMVFQLEFPPASLNFWSFISGYFFDISSSSESSYAVMDNIIQYLGTYES